MINVRNLWQYIIKLHIKWLSNYTWTFKFGKLAHVGNTNLNLMELDIIKSAFYENKIQVIIYQNLTILNFTAANYSK